MAAVIKIILSYNLSKTVDPSSYTAITRKTDSDDVMLKASKSRWLQQTGHKKEAN